MWQHPIYWYTVPALLKLWFEKVLAVGFAYGPGGDTLRGKPCLWVATAGGDDEAYRAEGIHQQPFGAFVPVVRQTAEFCGMTWLEPVVVGGAHKIDDDELARHAERYRDRLAALVAAERSRDG